MIDPSPCCLINCPPLHLQTILLSVAPEEADMVLRTFANIEIFVTYGTAALGYALQKLVIKYEVKVRAISPAPPPHALAPCQPEESSASSRPRSQLEDDGLGEDEEIKELKLKLVEAQQRKAKEQGKQMEVEKVRGSP